MRLNRKLASEGVGTAFLLAAVVGSGIMGDWLSQGNDAIALLANTLATGAALITLIITFGAISGAHFNPVVSLVDAMNGTRPWREVFAYIPIQIVGAFAGVAIAHLMFDEPLFSASEHVRSGWPKIFSEFVATFGLVSVILGCSKHRPALLSIAVGLYITAAYWFTASTSFANPAVTLARAATNSFAGIRPADVPAFIIAQLVGGAAAALFFKWLNPKRTQINLGKAAKAL